MELGQGGVDDVELREQTVMEIVVVLDGFTEVKNGGLGGGDWKRHREGLGESSEQCSAD